MLIIFFRDELIEADYLLSLNKVCPFISFYIIIQLLLLLQVNIRNPLNRNLGYVWHSQHLYEELLY